MSIGIQVWLVLAIFNIFFCLLCLVNKISDAIDSVALIKEIKIKNKDKNDLFDSEIERL